MTQPPPDPFLVVPPSTSAPMNRSLAWILGSTIVGVPVIAIVLIAIWLATSLDDAQGSPVAEEELGEPAERVESAERSELAQRGESVEHGGDSAEDGEPGPVDVSRFHTIDGSYSIVAPQGWWDDSQGFIGPINDSPNGSTDLIGMWLAETPSRTYDTTRAAARVVYAANSAATASDLGVQAMAGTFDRYIDEPELVEDHPFTTNNGDAGWYGVWTGDLRPTPLDESPDPLTTAIFVVAGQDTHAVVTMTVKGDETFHIEEFRDTMLTLEFGD